MNFDFDDYKDNQNKIFFDSIFSYLGAIDPKGMNQWESSQKDRLDLEKAYKALRARMSSVYFIDMYSLQSNAISYSRNIFPPYINILPDILIEDWLAIIDPHKDFARDHSVHQPLTAYVTAKLLGYGVEEDSLALPNNEKLLGWCVRRFTEALCSEDKTSPMWYLREYLYSLCPSLKDEAYFVKKYLAKKIIYETAIIAALFHDMGYPWQYVNRVQKSINAADIFANRNSQTHLSSELLSLRNNLLLYPFYGYGKYSHKSINELVDLAFSKTHGFPGAIAFSLINEQIRKKEKEKKKEKKKGGCTTFNDRNYGLTQFILDWAALAIMMHDIPGLYWGDSKLLEGEWPENECFGISLGLDPVSSIVSIADVLEDFHRPLATFSGMEGVIKSKNISYGYATHKTEIEVENNDTLAVKYEFEDIKQAMTSVKFKVKEVNEYFNCDHNGRHSKGFVDLKEIGIKRIRCEILANGKIVYSTP